MSEERAPLPSDPGLLEPLGPDFDATVRDGADRLGLALNDDQLRALELHARLLLAWNGHINLTAIRDAAGVATLHVLDSLTALPLIHRDSPNARLLVDLGSGGGYPGLPLAIAGAAQRTLLVDSVGKKVRFVEAAAAAVRSAAPGAEAVLARAEDLAADRQRRESADLVTARAVGSLAEIAELGLPLLRDRGLVIAWKRVGAALDAEVADAGPLIRACGGGRPRVHQLDLAELPGHVLVTLRKERATPRRFPRPPAARRLPC